MSANEACENCDMCTVLQGHKISRHKMLDGSTALAANQDGPGPISNSSSGNPGSSRPGQSVVHPSSRIRKLLKSQSFCS